VGKLAGVGRAEAVRRLDKIGIDPSRRPQTLTLEEWEALYRGFEGSALVNL